MVRKRTPLKPSSGPLAALGASVLTCLFLLATQLILSPTNAGDIPHLAYGFNVAPWDVELIQSLGFGWIKVFSPPTGPLSVNVLIRLEANANHMANVPAFGQQVHQLASSNGSYIDAYEIGNEPNLDASYGWGAPPIAAHYATLLCEAYTRIKQADPTAIVVSAGLAPTGRVSGNWQGHAGHNGLYQDERAFLREFLAAGGGACTDAFGYHPYGFSADYDAIPDVASGDPTRNCANGFCFRGAEKFYEIIQGEGYGQKKVWATEWGWLVAPPANCLADARWQGRRWQIISAQKQASNLRGAYEFADAHWPWMGAMFAFNLNFNTSGWYDPCEPMRYYGVEDRPAEPSLRDMAKNPADIAASLQVYPTSMLWLVAADEQPLNIVLALNLSNGGWQPLDYAATVDPTAAVVPLLDNASGTIAPTNQMRVQVTMESNGRPVGLYNGEITVAAPAGTVGAPATIPVELRVLQEVYRHYLPVVHLSGS